MREWNRVADWSVRLARAIEQHGNLPFAYGLSDCGQFAADAVFAVLGRDVLGPYRGYKTKTGAARVLRKACCNNLGDLFALHFKEGHKAHAMRGDIGIVLYDGEICAGVFTGHGFASKGQMGICYAEDDQILRVFEV